MKSEILKLLKTFIFNFIQKDLILQNSTCIKFEECKFNNLKYKRRKN